MKLPPYTAGCRWCDYDATAPGWGNALTALHRHLVLEHPAELQARLAAGGPVEADRTRSRA